MLSTPGKGVVMNENSFETIRRLPREELEILAIRAALRLRNSRREIETGEFFLAVLTGFLLGSLVAASGFLIGAGFS